MFLNWKTLTVGEKLNGIYCVIQIAFFIGFRNSLSAPLCTLHRAYTVDGHRLQKVEEIVQLGNTFGAARQMYVSARTPHHCAICIQAEDFYDNAKEASDVDEDVDEDDVGGR